MVGHLAFKPRDLPRREVADDVQLAAAIAVVGRAAVCRGVVGDGIQSHVGGIAEARVLAGANEPLGLPLGEHERAVGDHVSRLDPVVAQFLDDMRRYRVARGIDQPFGEERKRRRQADLQDVGVQRPHRQGLRGRPARVDIRGALDGVEEVGEARRRGGIEQTAEREHEVGGRNRFTVGPAGVLAEPKSPGETVHGRGPALGGARHDAALGVVGGQTLEQVGENLLLEVQVVAVRIEGERFAAVADSQLRGTGDHGHQRDQER